MADDDVQITGKVRDKLIERKQDWAREGRLLTGTTADPRQGPAAAGPAAGEGLAGARSWRPTERNGAEIPARCRWRGGEPPQPAAGRVHGAADVGRLSDMHCVTQWSRYDNHWKGVPARALLAIVQPSASR